jgi:hypothetical protein
LLILALLCAAPQSAFSQLSPDAEERLKALDREIRSLMNDVSESSDQIPSSIVWLNCTTHKPFVLLLPSSVLLTAACDDLQRLPEGYAVRLTFGNPMRAHAPDPAVRLWHGSTPLEAVTRKQRIDAALPAAVAAGDPGSTTITITTTAAEIGAIGVEPISKESAGPR